MLRKKSFLLFIVFTVASLMLVNCVKLPQVDTPTFGAGAVVIGNGVVTLTWNAVADATGYNVRLVSGAGSGSRAVFNVQVVGTQYEFDPAANGMPYGAYSWFVKALKDGKESEEGSGPAFNLPGPDYDQPQVATGNPVAGTEVMPDEPIVFTFEATPGALQAGERGEDIEELWLLVGSAQDDWDMLEVEVTGLDTYTWQEPGLEWGETYYWTVKAFQNDDEVEAPAVEFSALKQLELWLSEEPFIRTGARADEEVPVHWLKGDPIYGKVKANDPLIETAQIFIKEVGDTTLVPLENPHELDTSGEMYFTIPVEEDVDLASRDAGGFFIPRAGLFVAWGQGLGNLARSDVKPFEIKEPSGEIQLDAEYENCGDPLDIADGQSVCGPCTDECCEVEGATVTYTITVDLVMIAEWGVTFYLEEPGCSASQTADIPSSAFVEVDGSWQYATDVYFATECSKYATVTLWGTDSISDYWDASWDEEDHMFVLDLEDPTAAIAFEAGSFGSDMATITFLATDTKCLDQISFEFFVEKGEGDWELDVEWGDEDFIIGEGQKHEITGEGTYVKAANNETAWATLVLNLSEWGMDGATISVDVNVDDCCSLGVGHEVQASDEVYVDNVFFSSDIVDDDYGSDEIFMAFTNIFEDEDGKLWLPVPSLNGGDPANATMTFWLWDKSISDATVTFGFGDSATGSASVTSGATKSFVCTGYNLKDQWQVDLSMYGTPSALVDATSATLTIEATDAAGNLFSYPITVWMDLKPASLTYVQGYTDGTASGADDFVQFVFDQNVNPEFEGFAATLTIFGSGGGQAALKVYSQEEITQLDMTDKTGFQISTKNFTLPVGGSIQLEVYAQDLHGNVQLTTLAGGIAENASSR
ncbi:MAG TPA: hypothetical protein P5560_08815 [Thermotogota bacterium]|nr:hypothetical protein [Thermotogota bacterium]